MVQRRREHDLRVFVPLISDLTEPQYRLHLLFQELTLRHAASAIPSLGDSDVAEAAATLAATLETSRKGLIYEHQATSIVAQRLVGTLKEMVTGMVQEGAPAAKLERDAIVALRRLEQGARSARSALPDDPEPVFLNLMARLISRSEESEADARREPASQEAAGRLIIPG